MNNDPNGTPVGKRLPRRTLQGLKSDAERDETMEQTLRRYGLFSSPEPQPLERAGPKLKDLRERSGWTVSEIADRTGVPLDVLAAFEQGDAAAAKKLEFSDLERLASACCASLTDLLGPDVAAVRRALRRRTRHSPDPFF